MRQLKFYVNSYFLETMHIHFLFKESNNIYTYYMRQFKLHINSYYLGSIKEKEHIL